MKSISPHEAVAIQQLQYPDKIPFSGNIPAGQSLVLRANVSNLGIFICQRLTGDFETKVLDGVAIVDDGICRLRAKLTINDNRALFSDFVPLNLFLTPGRVRASGVLWKNALATIQADPSTALFYPNEFTNSFNMNTDILFEIKNSSTADNYVNIVMHGLRVMNVGVK